MSGPPLHRPFPVLAVILISAAALASCKNTSFYSVLGNKAQIQALTISPSSSTVPPNGTIQFSASGGVPPYMFSILSGVGTIDSSTGLYTAPATPGTTYVQVQDKDGSTAKATLTNVDYSVTSITAPSTSLFAGASSSGSFTVQNVGTANGAQNVSWTVYVSTANTLGAGGASTFAQGTTSALGAGASTSVPFTGTWPTTPGSYYLIVTVFASDGLVAANNTLATSSTIAIAAANVNYVASAVTVTSGTSSPPSGAMAGTFTLTNSGANSGTQYVAWQAYASTTTTITSFSVLIDSGTHAPLAAGASTPITVTGSWPLAYGFYYLVVRSSVPVDTNPSNNVPFSSASTTAVGIYSTSEPNDSTAQANNLGVTFRPGMSVQVTGSLTTSDLYDYLSFNAGTASTITFNLTWGSTAITQTITMWVYNALGVVQPPGLATSDNTYLIMSWPVGANAGATCYISPQLTGSPSTGTYTLIITAN